MPGKTIGKSLDLGYPGTFSRMADCVIANRVAKDTLPFGAPAVLNPDNTFSHFDAGHTAEDFVGVAVREVKQQTDFHTVHGSYFAGDPTDVLMRGSIMVAIQNGTPEANGTVYLRIEENPAYPECRIGGFEAEADGSHTVALHNVKFTTGQMDANQVAEITILTRQA